MDIIALAEVGSTQTAARLLLAAGATLPFAVTATTQSQGRGRGDHTWASAPGGLWCTLACQVPQPAPYRQASLVAGLSVAAVLRQAFRIDSTVKWPNDVLVQGRKVAGILAEMLIGNGPATVLLGIGINVNNTPDPLSLPDATSLAAVLGRQVDLKDLLHRTLDRVTGDLAELGRRGFLPFAATANSMLALRDARVTVEFGDGHLSGFVRGIDDAGDLLLEETSGNITAVDAGDVRSL